MNRPNANPCDLRRTMEPSLDAVEAFCSEFRARAQWLPQRDRFEIELLLREALTNAVLHGVRSDRGERVDCVLRLKRGRAVIVVRDDGDGFDWRAARNGQASISSCSGRGMEIFRQYATHIRFNRTGNCTSIVKRF